MMISFSASRARRWLPKAPPSRRSCSLIQGTDDERLFAAQRLTQVLYTDAEVVGLLQTNTQAARAAVRAASALALAHIA
jgi:hypothetical protein